MKAINTFYDLVEPCKIDELVPKNKEMFAGKYLEMFENLVEIYKNKGMLSSFLSFLNFRTLENSRYLYDFLREKAEEVGIGDDYDKLLYLSKNLDSFLHDYVINFNQKDLFKLKLLQFYALKPAKAALRAKEEEQREERRRKEAIEQSISAKDYSIYTKIGSSPFESKLRSLDAEVKPRNNSSVLRSFEVHCHYPIQVFEKEGSEMIDIIGIMTEVEDFHRFYSPSEFPVFPLNFEYMRNLLSLVQNRLMKYYKAYMTIEPYCREPIEIQPQDNKLERSRLSAQREEEMVKATINLIDLLDFVHLKLVFREFRTKLKNELKKVDYLEFVNVLSTNTDLALKRSFLQGLKGIRDKENKYSDKYNRKIKESVFYVLLARKEKKRFEDNMVKDFRKYIIFGKMKGMVDKSKKRKEAKSFSVDLAKTTLLKKVFKSIRYNKYMKKYDLEQENLANMTADFHNRYKQVSSLEGNSMKEAVELDQSHFVTDRVEEEVRQNFTESISARDYVEPEERQQTEEISGRFPDLSTGRVAESREEPSRSAFGRNSLINREESSRIKQDTVQGNDSVSSQKEDSNHVSKGNSRVDNPFSPDDLAESKEESQLKPPSTNREAQPNSSASSIRPIELPSRNKISMSRPLPLNSKGSSYNKREYDHTLSRLSKKINTYLDTMNIVDESEENNFRRDKRELNFKPVEVSQPKIKRTSAKIQKDFKKKRFSDIYTESERELDDLLGRAIRGSREKSRVSSSRRRKSKKESSDTPFEFTNSVSRDVNDPSFRNSKKTLSRIEFDVFA